MLRVWCILIQIGKQTLWFSWKNCPGVFRLTCGFSTVCTIHTVFEFCHNLSSQVLSQFEFCHILSFWVFFSHNLGCVTIWVLSQLDFLSKFDFHHKLSFVTTWLFFHNSRFVTIWVLSLVPIWIFEFCHNLSCWVLSLFQF